MEIAADMPRPDFESESNPEPGAEHHRTGMASKRKRSRERSRVTRACDRCKRYADHSA